ncbi:MAG: DUF11 domain-containing protein [Candidatus Promineofilum sp.]|nr:DUF11 domain-containing protein [Promineifilum sp.]
MSTTLKRRSLTILGMVLLAAFLGVTFNRASAANPAPVMVFHLTEPENDMLAAMQVINAVAVSPMVTKVSIAISADGTLVYYDHWEDGFADDIANPTPSEIYSAGNLDGVQIWGNGLASDGCAPQIGNTVITCTNANDVLNKGNVIILDDSSIVVPNTAGTIDWDGKDKIGGTNAIAVTRSLWASGSNSLFAWANAMYPTTEWGQVYTTPVGCDTITATADMFEYSAFTITAAYDGTVIQTDPEGDGTWEANVTLNEGQTYFESTSSGGACSYVKQGGQVRSNDPAKPIQVVLVTGDIAGSPGYGSRDLNLVPDAQLSSSYWMPVGNNTGNGVDSQTPGTVRLYIYNPEATTMYVRCERPSTSTVYTIAADTVNTSFTLSNDQAGHCFAVTGASSTTPDTSRKFTGVAAVDNDGTIWDWGVPFVPEDRLSNQALVGLGAGRDWTSGTNPNQNGSPLWVTPICQTFFYVDWNNDGTPDKVDFNGDNDVTDTNVNGLNETTSNTGFQVSTLQSARLYDASDLDQTGAYVFTKTVANNGGVGGCNFAAAWGEDPRVASAAAPGLDAGTIIVALRSVETSKDSVLLIDADSSGSLTPGDTLRYIITVENTGLAPVAVTVEDTLPTNTTYVANSTAKDVGSGFVAIPDNGSGTPFPLDNGGVSLGSLPEGDSWQVRFSVTINSLPAGQTVDISNCAEITYDSSLVETCKTNPVTVPTAPALTLDKTTSTAYYNAAGNTISYSYLLTNTGNVPLTPPYAVSDNKATVTCPQTPNPLPIGSSITCTATYTVISADVTAGQVVNIATATAQYGGNPVTSNQDTVTVPLAALNVVKSSTTTVITAVGQIVPYTFTVTNTGNVALTGVTVSDPKCTSAISGPTGDTNSNGKLDLTETWVYSCTHTVTLAEMNAGGNLANTVTADSTETPPDTDPHNIPITQTPALTLDKATTTANYDQVGDTISYNYTVTNSGNVSLIPPYAVTDNKIVTPNVVTCNQTPNPLNPGASFTCTATYTVTQADLTAGSVTNIASGTAKHGANTVTSNTDTVTVPAVQTPALTLDKTTTTANYDQVGDTISYSYKVTNSGNVPLTPPYAVSDNKTTVSCPQTPNPLDPGQFITCTATYVVTQADITAGSVVNIATATAKHGNDTVTSNQDTVTVPAVQLPALSLDKDTTTANYDQVGDTIAYTYKVTNSGNVPLTPPYAVSDNKTTVTCPQTPNPLVPGAFITCTATYTVTQADLNAGSVVNIATASAKYGNDTVTSNQDTVTVPALQGPALTLDKDTSTPDYDAVGDTIQYTYKVTNSGNISLQPPYAVTDNKIGAPNTVVCQQLPSPLLPGQFFTCTATYTVTQADINAGSVVNVAQATAMNGANPVTSNTDTVTVPAVQLPGLSLDKTTTTGNYDQVGDTISYSYKVTNSGNVPLTPPYAVSDNKTTVNCPQTPNPLNPGQFITCTATYVVTQADITAGSVVNVAKASAMYGNQPVESNEDTVTVPAVQLPALTLDKTTTTTNYDSVGDPIVYSYLVTNSGNVPLTPPYAVSDNKTTVICPQTPNPLMPGAFITCSATYLVTQADLDAGSVTNTAQASAMYGVNPVLSNQDSVTVTADQGPALTLEKSTTTANYDQVGDTISYSYKVTNSGNVSLTPPYAVSDNKATVSCPQTPNPLVPGAFITCTASYVVTQADINAGSVTNIATATAKHGNDTVTSNQDTVTVPAVQLPGLTLDKTTTTANYDSVGDTISYSYKVTNSGNVPLTPPYAVSDNKTTVTCNQTPNPLNPGDFFTCTATYTVTQADITAGSVVNIATASAMHGTAPVNSNQDTVTVPAVQLPALTLDKTTTTTSYDSVGDPIVYSYKVTNSGNVPVTIPYAVNDDHIIAPNTVNCPQTPNPLMPGQFITCTATYNVTQADITAGEVINVAQASAMYGSNPVLSNTDTVTVTMDRIPGLNVEKSTTTTLITAAGQMVDYRFAVTNTGNIPLTNVTVSDPMCDLPPTGPTGDADNDGKLDLNETWVYTCIHTVTQAEMDSNGGGDGDLDNTVTADSTETDPDTDDLFIPIQQTPGLNVEKSSTTQLITQAGQQVTYTFDVTNTGNISLTGVTVSDPMCDAAPTGPTGDTNNDGKLGLLETWTFSCVHTVTQAEIDAATGPNPQLHNVVTADSNETPPDTDPWDIPIQYNPGLNVVKSSTTALITAIGQQVPYQFTVTNTGNVTLTGVTVTDAKCNAAPVLQPGGDANNDGKMQVTEIWVFTCTHTVTLTEMNAGGNLHNVVTADSNETPPDTAPWDIPIQQSPALTLDKDTTTVNYDSVGDTIAYTYKVTNSGNVSLTPPYAVTDNKIGAPNVVTCNQTPNPLNPGDFFTCTATYTVTQADLDAGSVTNIASGSAMHGQTPVISNNDTVTVPAIQTPLLEVTKVPNKTVVASGDLVTFTILVENKGTITLSLNSLVDSVYGDITTTGHNGITATTCDVTPPVTLAALTGTYTCTFTAAVTGNANTTHTNTVTACDTTKNPDVCDDGSADVRIIPAPAIEVVKTANPTQLYTPGGPVVFTIVINNTGGGALTLTSLTDNVFGNITTIGHNGITATTCAVPQTISQGGSYTCQFTATVNGPAGTVHTDIVTGSGTGFNGASLTDNDDAVVNIIAIPTVNTCPANQATNQWTDILGVGMGTTSSHKLQAKLVVPNSANLVALYGQLSGKQQGGVKYVRFTYPNGQYVQVDTATSPAPRTWGVFWYGTELNPSANIRGRWFLQSTGVKGHVPRAFILYPTYNNPNQRYINVFEVINTGDSQVYWNVEQGWIPSRQLVIDIPSPMARATFNVEVAVVDNDKDARPVYVTVSAGGVSQTQSPINPNKGNLLNILSFTLANVPAGTGEIVVTITSPAPNTNGLGALGGDSAAITGVTANYLCVDVPVIP